MTDTQTEAPPTPSNIDITERMEQIIRHMLENPRGAYCVSEIARALSATTGTITPIVHLMRRAGWLSVEVEPRRPGSTGPLRKMYRFTRGTAPMLRRAIDA